MFSPNEIVEIVRQGILKYARGEYKIPERMHIHRGQSTNLIMPAFGEKYYCTKLVSVDPLNHLQNLPIISGIVLLNDSKTGATIATMDAPMITALRTAAIGSIGLDLICDNKMRKLGIIGLGVQGLWQTIFALSTRHISEINCYSRNKIKFAAYQKYLLERFPDVLINWCSSAEDVVQNSEAVISCTTSKSPVFIAQDLDIYTKRFVSVGSFAKDMQEYPKEVYMQADAIIIDSKSAKTEVGDLVNSIRNNWVSQSNIYSLADIIVGNKSIKKQKNIVFKSVGMAAFDLALAVAAYERRTKN